MTIQSDSAEDALGETGAEVITIMYHDSDGIAQELDVTMDGVTGVSVPSNYGIFRMIVKQSGSANTNVGKITVTSGVQNILRF